MANIYMRLTGNDSNDGSTPALAVATLTRAHAVATAGDTIYIGGGTHNQLLVGGLTKNNLTIIGDSDGAMTGDAGLARINNTTAGETPFSGLTGTNIVFRNLAITTTVTSYALYTPGVDSSTVKFIDCIIWGGYGLSCQGSFINCLIYGTYSTAAKPQIFKNCIYAINTIEAGGTPLSIVTSYNMGYANSSYIEDPTNNNFKLKVAYLDNIQGDGTTDANLDNTDIMAKYRNTSDPWIGPYDAGSYSISKLLIQDGTTIYKISGGNKVSAGTAPVTESMFTTDGMSDLSGINDTTIRLFTNPKILLYKT